MKEKNVKERRNSVCILRMAAPSSNILKDRDKNLGEVIDKIGYIEREIDPDLFSSVVHHIIPLQLLHQCVVIP